MQRAGAFVVGRVGIMPERINAPCRLYPNRPLPLIAPLTV